MGGTNINTDRGIFGATAGVTDNQATSDSVSASSFAKLQNRRTRAKTLATVPDQVSPNSSRKEALVAAVVVSLPVVLAILRAQQIF